MCIMNLRPRLLAIITVATAVAAAAVVGGYAAAQTSPPGPTQIQPPYVARNQSGDPVLTVQLQQGISGTGQFYFTVTAVGQWSGVITVQPTGHSPVVRLRGEADSLFTPNNSDYPVAATVRMDGTIDTAHNSATINVWATRPGKPGETHYLINTNPPPQSRKAVKAARAAAGALQAQDWDALYKTAASMITSQYTKAQFMEVMTAQHGPRIRDITPAAAGTISDDSGQTYYTQTFKFFTVENGKTAYYTTEIILIWEHKTWRFAGTTAPASAG
jgi:hypothetical protein